MFYFIFFITFSLALLFANIYCFIKKKYLYLFIPCMLFLPEYYGFEFNESFPILTITRIMFIIFYIYSFINRKITLSLNAINPKKTLKKYSFLLGYFFFRILSNLYYLTSYSDAIKTIFEIIFEQFLLIIAFLLLSPSKKELTHLLKVVVWSSFSLYLIGIFESITYIRPFDALYTVNRYMLNQHYIRLGFLRSVTTMGMPGLYSNMCLLMIPLILYLYNITLHKRYLFVLFFNILAGIHSGSRAYFFYLFATLIFYFIFVLKTKALRLRCIKNIFVVLIALLTLLTILCLRNVYFKYFYVTSAKSVLNEIGFNFDLNANAPYGVEGYGKNSGINNKYTGGIISRNIQLSGIIYTLTNSPFFGFGNGALQNDKVMYYTNQWVIVKSIDVGLVEVIVLEGILGLLGYTSLLFFFISKMPRKDKTFQLHILSLYIFCYALSTLSTCNMPHFLMLASILFVSKIEQK